MLTIHTLDNIHETAREFISQIGKRTVFAFNGKMGVGKTTFIKAICHEMGVKETVNSPTFSIVNEYNGNPLDSLTLSFLTFKISSRFFVIHSLVKP